MPRLNVLPWCLVALCGMAAGQTLNCDLQAYKPMDGLKAEVRGGALEFAWRGEGDQQLRADFTVRDGQPQIQELAARKNGGQWAVLGNALQPEFHVTSGKRRMSQAQATQFKLLNIEVTQELYDKEKWNTFWDAPLVVPGVPGRGDSFPLPRDPSEVRRASASFHSDKCQVNTEGARLAVTFSGLEMGIFSGDLRFTVYRGSNLLRQEAVAKTNEPSVAYIYSAGLRGFDIAKHPAVAWRDTARAWQKYEFGGAKNTEPVGLRARNRLVIVDAGSGSVAVFPPPHKFFFAREDEINLGYVYYRKDSDSDFGVGVMQPEKGEGYHPWGVTDAEWKRRSATSESHWDNYALYNAPAGTLQHMAVYFYLSPEGDRTAQQSVMAYTHDDVYKALPGYKVLASHFHMDFNEMLRDRNTLDYRPPFVDVFRALGVNIVNLGDFHDDSDPRDPGPKRLMEQRVYFEGTARISDRDLLFVPGEEVNSYLGGHWWLMTPRPIYFTHSGPRPANQPFVENNPEYGQVYHLGSPEDVMNLVNREHAILYPTHPRTKNTAGYPDAIRDKDFFLTDRDIGSSWESLPVDLSEKRLCEVRCFGVMDDSSNWAPAPKFMLAEGDTYTKWPDDETYPFLAVNYIKLDRVPSYAEGWASVVEALRAGNFFGTTGEVLFHNYGVSGSGAHRVYTANIEWTFPLEFAELVWSDGNKVDRQIIPATEMPPFASHEFKIPFDATGKKWVRFAVWDSAGDGAYTQPVALNETAQAASARNR
jgi:hypothetical protein